jgi:A/G-specific adenine glycosylase
MDSTTWEDYFVGGLLKWHRANKRKFRWRKESDPYKILISELMLQRTQARQVEPVYLKFVANFPDPPALADASVGDIESVLYPLGLAHRGIRIKRMAEQLRDRYNGVVPDNIDALLDLSGVGLYVASAVLSFGFGRDTAVVDANVARVIMRFFSFNPKTVRPHTDRGLWSFCQKILPSGSGPDFNRALLDFAAAICTARKPQHERCPVRDHCEYYEGEPATPAVGG